MLADANSWNWTLWWEIVTAILVSLVVYLLARKTILK